MLILSSSETACRHLIKVHLKSYLLNLKNVSKKVIEQSVFLIRNNQGQYLLQKRSEKLLHGMWQFPMFEKVSMLDVK